MALLSTAYLPPVSYFAVMARYGNVKIEAFEHFQKQSYRTRTLVASAEGVQVLSVPVLREDGHKRLISDIRIDYRKDWISVHKRALASYYGSSPFFEYYADDIFGVLDSRPEFLLDLNTSLTRLMAELLGIRCSISYTEDYLRADGQAGDFREAIHPKRHNEILSLFGLEGREYYQVFSYRTGFLPDLSGADLLFNEGPNSLSFLR